jgi:hypothetical protein
LKRSAHLKPPSEEGGKRSLTVGESGFSRLCSIRELEGVKERTVFPLPKGL